MHYLFGNNIYQQYKQINDKIKNVKIKHVYLDCHSTIFIINNQQTNYQYTAMQ